MRSFFARYSCYVRLLFETFIDPLFKPLSCGLGWSLQSRALQSRPHVLISCVRAGADRELSGWSEGELGGALPWGEGELGGGALPWDEGELRRSWDQTDISPHR